MIPAIFLGLMVSQLALCLGVLRRRPTPWRALLVHTSLLLCGGALTFLLGLFGNRLFLPMQLMAWLLFLLWPGLLVGGAWLLRQPHPRLAGIMAIAAAAAVVVAVWSIGIEPRWLEISHHSVVSPKLRTTVRIALVADLQTDRWGRYERRIFEELSLARPDLVLFAGDYLQPDDMPAFEDLLPSIRGALVPACEAADLGCWAVRGDVDPDAWPHIFETANAEVITRATTRDLGPLVLTALNPEEARSELPPIWEVERFHVVMGHAPDFAVVEPPADLLLAGHIHGGQVRLPGLGPLLTLSRVPRAWAAGRTELPWGGTLIVSRGLGLERGDAPRLRLFCRPELVIIDLVPSDPTEDPRGTSP